MPRPFQPLKKINNSSGINERFCIKMRVFSRDSDSRNSVSDLLLSRNVVRNSIFDAQRADKWDERGNNEREEYTRVYIASPLDTDGMFQQGERAGSSYGKWRAASGG